MLDGMTGLRPPSMLRVLVYHRLEDGTARRQDLNPDLVTASTQRFESHLQLLARHYHPVGMDEVLSAAKRVHGLPERAVLVTFDDAYRDFGELAWPLLKRYRIPAVLFVPTAFPGQSERVFWWDAVWQMVTRTPLRWAVLPAIGRAPLDTAGQRHAASDRLVDWLKTLTPGSRPTALTELSRRLQVSPEPTNAVLSWPQLRALADDGVAVAGHSRTHELLDQLDVRALRDEVTGCRDDLVREIGECVPAFAYPNGNLDARLPGMLETAGFQVGFTTRPGLTLLGPGAPWLVRREDARATCLKLAVKLSTPVAALRARRTPFPAMD
jgi:peptidoglycan/xylan/chitin deacetylase (PgdA/CDA1 family)